MRSIGRRKGAVKILFLAAVLLSAAIMVGVSIQNQNQTTIPLIYQNLFPYMNTPGNQPILKADETWGDTTISNTTTKSNMEIILNGNLTIANSGILTLTNVTLRVNCTANGEHRIEVQNNGTLYINGSSIITAYNTSNSFLFWVQSNATFQMNDSQLSYCGYSHSNLDHRGLWINTNNTIIENNNLTNNYYGVILDDAHHNTIRNNQAANNAFGFYLNSSSNNDLTGNTALNCTTGYNWVNSINNDFTGSVVANYLRVNVTSFTGTPIQGADVEILTDGTQIYATPYFGGSDPTTDSNGLTPWIDVPYRTFTTNDTMTENSTSAEVYYQGYFIEDNPRTVNMSTSHMDIFQTDNANPTVDITVPANDTTVNTGIVWINGTYDGTGSNITAISCNNTNFTLQTSPPFGVTGTYSFMNNTPIDTSGFGVQINVTDQSGFTEIASRYVIVDQDNPTVTITVPSSDETLNTGVIWINGTYDGTGSNITAISCNDTSFSLQTSPPFGETGTYSFVNNTPIATGAFWVQITVTDQASLTEMALRNVIVDQDNPQVTITVPASDDTVNTGIIWINGTYDGTGSNVTDISCNDTSFSLQTSPPFGVTGSYSFQNNTPIGSGEFWVQINVTDQIGFSSTASRRVIVDQDNPTVEITVPPSDDTINSGVIWINGTYNGTGSTVQSIVINDSRFVLVVGSPFAETGSYSFRNNSAIPTEEFGVTVTVTDGGGLTAYAERQVRVDQTLPLVSITVPATDTSVNTGVIWVNGTYDGTGSNVTDISCNDTRFSLQTSPPFGETGTYSFMNNTPVATEEFWIQVTVTDQVGLTGAASRYVIVDQDNPTVEITVPPTDDTVNTGIIWINGTYNGTGSIVQSIVINDTRFDLVAGTPFAETGAYAFRNNTAILTEEFGVRVTVTDGAGLTVYADRHVIVDQSVPLVSITVPATDTTVNTGVIWINGTYDGIGSNITSILCNDTRFDLQTSPPFGETGTFSFVNNTPIATSEFGVQINVTDQVGFIGTAQRHIIVDQDNPTIIITVPANDTTLNTGVIWINGTYDGTGSIVQSIVINDSRFVLVAGSPFAETGSYAFQNNTAIPTGEFGVRVTVTDGGGLTAYADRYVIVDQSVPTVSITTPASDSTVNTGDIWIRGFYNGTGSNVTSISCNDGRFTLVTVPPFGETGSYSFVNNTPIATSEFGVQINVTDQMGFIGTAQRHVIVDQDNPTVAITIPASDDTVNSGVIWINGTYDGTGSIVQSIVINDSRFALVAGSPFAETGSYAFRNNTAIPTQEFGVRITVTDGAGLTTYADRHVIVDQSVPLVSITVPANDSTVNTGIIWINGTYNGMGSNVTTISCNDTRFTLQTSPPFGETGTFSFVNNTPIATSEFGIQVSVTDQSSLTGTDERHMIVDQDQPAITILVPASDSTLNTGVIWINGTYDGTGSIVQSIVINDSRFALVAGSPFAETGSYAFRNNTAIPTEEFGVRITVTDGAGFTDYADRHIIVDQTAPSISITVPATDSTVNTGVIWINGTYDETGSSITTISCNDTRFTLQTSPPFGTSGTYSFVNNTPISTSEFSVQITVTDQAGLIGTASRHVIVDQSLPSVSITYPASDTSIITGIIWINGTYDGTGSTVQSIAINDTRFDLVAGTPFSETGTYAFRNNTAIPTEEFGVRVTVTDGAGFTAYAERHVIVDQDIPLVSITIPAFDTTVNTGIIWINGTYDGRQSNVVQIICDDTRFTLVTSPPFGITGNFSFVNNTPIATSMFWIQINVTDESSLTGTASRRMNVDQDIPLVSITFPATDSTVNTGFIWINGTYNGTGSNVQDISCNDTRFDLQTSYPFLVTGSYAFVNNTPISTEIFYVQVSVTDGAGLIESAVRRVVVDQSPPTVTVTTPYSDDTINVGTVIIRGVYDGTGSDIVQITCNDTRFTLQNSAPFGATGTYVFINNTNIYDGNWGLMVTVRDVAGFESFTERHLSVRQSGVTGSVTWECGSGAQWIDAYSVADVLLWVNTTAPLKVYITRTTTILGGDAPSGYELYGSFWSISVNDTDAIAGVRIYISYSNESIANAGLEENSLRIRYWDDATGMWIEIPTTLDIENKIIIAYTDHLTNFAILGTLVPAGVPISFYLQFLLFSQLTTSQINPLLYLVLVFLAIAIVIVSILVVRGIQGRRMEEAFEIEAPLSLVKPEAPGKPKCLYCGSDIPVDAKYCSYCGETKPKCSVCNRHLFYGDAIAECPYCGALSHKEHLLQWISLKGVCPKCKEKLSAGHVKLKDFFESR